MYTTCIYCTKPLGANEVVEHFPVGRRLAFDSARGRLWVVCRFCERWNLTPLDTRWEAVEECERLFRETRLRMSTDNIGLARLAEGLELVRIGEPLRPEFAAWRYGDQFGRRRRKAILYGVAGGTAVVAVLGGLAVAGVGVGIAPQIPSMLVNLRVRARIRTDDGRVLKVRGSDLHQAKLLPPLGLEGSWDLHVKAGSRSTVFSGPEALRVAGVLLPAVNSSGGSAKKVQEAVRTLEAAGGPEAMLARRPDQFTMNRGSWRTGRRPVALTRMDVPDRLALEMALHEEQERRALAGELLDLEAAWRVAEEIAGIADAMFVSEATRESLERLKAGRPAGEPGPPTR